MLVMLVWHPWWDSNPQPCELRSRRSVQLSYRGTGNNYILLYVYKNKGFIAHLHDARK